MNEVFHVVTSIVGLLTPYVLYVLKTQRDNILGMQREIQSLTTQCAVLRSETDNLSGVFNGLSRKLDDVNDKLGEVLSFKPLLEDALGSIRDLRRSRQ